MEKPKAKQSRGQYRVTKTAEGKVSVCDESTQTHPEEDIPIYSTFPDTPRYPLREFYEATGEYESEGDLLVGALVEGPVTDRENELALEEEKKEMVRLGYTRLLYIDYSIAADPTLLVGWHLKWTWDLWDRKAKEIEAEQKAELEQE